MFSIENKLNYWYRLNTILFVQIKARQIAGIYLANELAFRRAFAPLALAYTVSAPA